MTPSGGQSSFDLREGDVVAVAYAGGVPAGARVVGFNPERPHLIKVIYEHSRTAAWIAAARVVAASRDGVRL